MTNRRARAFADLIRQAERPGHLWTPEMVTDRLVEGAKLIERTAGRAGPSGHGLAWPAVRREWGDLLAMADEGDYRGRNLILASATRRQVDQAEQAMGWASRYVPDHHMRRALQVWVASRVKRRPFGAACKRLGLARATAYRLRDTAISMIAMGLCRDGVEP